MKRRNFGLDIVRALAIILVLVNHSINYFASTPLSQPIGDLCGIYGVEIFFVLSGFLIGQIYFRDVFPKLSKGAIKIFYIRRWMRTLPLYYLLLILFILIDNLRNKTISLYPFHFVFLQNLVPHGLDFFSVSWSLAIEEWFYFLFPLAALLFYKKFTASKDQMKFLGIVIIIIVFCRLLFVILNPIPYESIRRFIPLRFDSILIGVYLAGMKFHAKQFYKLLQKPSIFLLIFAVLAISLYIHFDFYTRSLLDTSIFAKGLSLSLMSILLALLLPFFEISSFLNILLAKISPLKWILTWVSLLSYSIYLVHLEIFDLTKVYLKNTMSLISILPLALAITLVLSYILYKCIEKPIMDMRENFK